MIAPDNGTEFTSHAILTRLQNHRIEWRYIAPGKPMQNGYAEFFNGKFMAECLNAHWFMILDDAREKMGEWLHDYNEVRPHSAIGNKPPMALQNDSDASQMPWVLIPGKIPAGWSKLWENVKTR